MIKYSDVKNPCWSDLAKTYISIEVTFEHCGTVMFSCRADDDTAHGREIFARANAGNYGPIAEYVAPIVPTAIPALVSFFQGCAALQSSGYLDAVEAYMAGPATPVEKLAWRTITEIRRASPMTEKLAAMLGLTETQVDDLFILAATIEA